MRDRQATVDRPGRQRAAGTARPPRPAGSGASRKPSWRARIRSLRPGGRAGRPGGSGRPGKSRAGRRWTNLRPAIVILAVLVLAGGVWGTVMYSPLFDTEKVSVRGTAVLTPEQITDAAKVPVGKPLARVDLGAIERRIAALPRVASVSVTRDWPHTVKIRVTERQVAAVMPDSGRFAEIDKTGVRFGTVDAVPQGVPVIKADPATVDDRTLRGVVEVIGALPPAVAPRVRDISARTRDDIVMTLDDGVLVMWGGAGDSPRKAEVLVALMALKTKVKVYDVSVPEAPATRNTPL